jgi:alcohol dehydrogenase class IV
LLAELEPRRILLVAGRASYALSGAEDVLSTYLEPYEFSRWSTFGENPKMEHLERGLAMFQQIQPDLIMAVGGGSALDMAKLIKVFSGQSRSPLDYVQRGDPLQSVRVPLIAIPTTAGSGSQATHFAVLYIGRDKYSVAHPCMLPDVALVDPALLQGLPASVAASAGLDALNQGIESYWSIHSTAVSRQYAREAIELAWANLRNMVQRPDDSSRLAMARAAHRAGEAIDITRTTAPHAVSYPITSYFGVPHGHAVGLVLGAFLEFNAKIGEDDCSDTRGACHVRETIREIAHFLGETDARGAAEAYNSLMDDIGLARDLLSLGIETRADLELIVRNGFNPQRMGNNPRLVTGDALLAMLLDLQRS